MSSIAVDDLDNAVDCVVDGAVDDAVDDAVDSAVDGAVDNAVDGAVRHCCRYSQLSRQHQAQITAVGELCGSILRGAGYVREKRELILSRAVGCGLDRQEVIAALIKYRKNPFTPTREARADFVLELRELYPAPAGRCPRCAANR